MDELIRQPRDPRCIGTDDGPCIVVTFADIQTRPAQDRRHISLHQDAGYRNLDPLDIVTACVALTPATSASGCMRFLPGTHLLGRAIRDERQTANNMLFPGQTARSVSRRGPAHDNELEPGAMSLHHALLGHADTASLNATLMSPTDMSARRPAHLRHGSARHERQGGG